MAKTTQRPWSQFSDKTLASCSHSRLSSKWAVKWLVRVPTAGIWPTRLALKAEQSDVDSRLKLLARPWESDQGFRWTKAFGSQPHPTKKYLLHACTLCIPILCKQLEAGTRRVLLTVGSSEDLSGVVGTQFFTEQDHFHILYKS